LLLLLKENELIFEYLPMKKNMLQDIDDLKMQDEEALARSL
jgi:hypothetical protein